jgi:hypothetical protein
MLEKLAVKNPGDTRFEVTATLNMFEELIQD